MSRSRSGPTHSAPARPALASSALVRAAVLAAASLVVLLAMGVAAFGTATQTRVNTNPPAPSDQQEAAVSGPRIVWEDTRNGNDDIYMFNAATMTESAVTTGTLDQFNPDIWGDWVVYGQYDPGSGTGVDVLAKNLASGEVTVVTSAPNQQSSPAIWNNTVVWEHGGSGGAWQIWTKNLVTGETTAVTTGTVDKASPDVSGDWVVWVESTSTGTGTDYDIRGKNLVTKEETDIAVGSDRAMRASIDDTVVVWENQPVGSARNVRMKNLVTGIESAVTTSGGQMPSVGGGWVVWQAAPRFNEVCARQVGGGAVSVLATSLGQQQFPVVSDPYVAWYEWRTNSYDVYYVEMGGSARKANGEGSTPSKQTAPAVSGTRIAWTDDRNGSATDIYMRDLATGEETAVCTAGGAQRDPVMSGDLIAWVDSRESGWRIWAKDLVTRVETAASVNASTQANPAVSGKRVVWEESRGGGVPHVFMKDLSTGVESVVANDPAGQQFPAISGDLVAYGDYRDPASDIYVRNVKTGVESAVATGSASQTKPSIDGDLIVWQELTADWDIWMKDLGTGVVSNLTSPTGAGNQQYPKISRGLVTWIDERAGYKQVYAMNLTTRETTALTTLPGAAPADPAAYGALVAWTDHREATGTNDPNIYMAWADFSAPAATVTVPALSAMRTSSFKVSWTATDPAPASGLTSVTVERKTGAGGTWSALATSSGDGSAAVRGTPGTTICFRARASDRVGNVGVWTVEKSVVVPYDERSLAYRGTWRRVRSGSYYLGGARYSVKRGSSARMTLRGARSITLIGTKRRDGGYADVFIGSRRVKRVSLFARRTQVRALIPVITYRSAKNVTLKIVVVGRKSRGSRGYRVELDGIAVKR